MLKEEKEYIGETGKSILECFETLLSKKERARVLAAECDGIMQDLSYILVGGEILSPIFLEDEKALDLIRHSTAHIMAAAVKKLFPEAKVSIGPSIATGFYYDFDVQKSFTVEDLPKIEAEMKAIVATNVPFIRKDITKAEAISLFQKENEPYKIELLDSIPEESVSLYTCGEFTDLCRGPHVSSTGFLGAFSLLSVAGAYFRGDENNAMLSRIYGTAFPTNKALNEYLLQIEEAKKRDHRKLGAQLELFGFQEHYAPGMVYWYPKGMLLRTILESLLKKEHLRRSYDLVQGPQLLRSSLWEKSGHYDNYRENMYFTEVEGDLYGIKPMNCVSHMLIYKNKMHSYRDLPVRLFELGVVHRHEKSGTLHGLMRVRQFTQDDAHIICTPEQLEDELVDVLIFIRDLLQLFEFSYRIEISTRPEKSIGSAEDWERATKALIGAAEREKIEYTINEGDGAFYGPKIDVKLLDCIGREWQCSTVQCDFTLPERFDLTYIGVDGEKHRPVMVHRAIFGSIERFIGILTEHYAGAFPAWLSPIQARILTITDDHSSFAHSVREELIASGVRADLDCSNNKLGYKIRLAQLEKIPYILVIGDKEMQDSTVNVRLRSGENLGPKTVQEVFSLIEADCMQPFTNGGIGYKFF